MTKLKSRLPTLVVSLIILQLTANTTLAQQQAPVSCKSPLTVEQLSRLLKSGVADARVQVFIKECGVGFEVSNDIEQQLQVLGVSEALLKLVRSASERMAEERKRKEEELRRREEGRLLELRQKLGLEDSPPPSPEANLALGEARQRLASLREQTANIETRLKTLYPNLQVNQTVTKDTFETTAEYQARVANAAADHKNLEERYKKDLDALTATYNRQISELLSRQYYLPGSKLVLTSYDADSQTLFTTFGSCSYRFHLPPQKAKGLYDRKDGLQGKGDFLSSADSQHPTASQITLVDSQTHEDYRSDSTAGPCYATGFSPGDLTLNGSAKLTGDRLRLTDAAVKFQAASAFWSRRVGVEAFTTDFDFQLLNAHADGFTFAIQNFGPQALGPAGAGLGYGADSEASREYGPFALGSVAVKVQFYQLVEHNNAYPQLSQHLGLLIDAQSPTTSNVLIESTPFGLVPARPNGPCCLILDVTNGSVYSMHIDYHHKSLSITITDKANPSLAFSRSWEVDIPRQVASKVAYVGFTAGTGDQTSTQEILNWMYNPGTPDVALGQRSAPDAAPPLTTGATTSSGAHSEGIESATLPLAFTVPVVHAYGKNKTLLYTARWEKGQLAVSSTGIAYVEYSEEKDNFIIRCPTAGLMVKPVSINETIGRDPKGQATPAEGVFVISYLNSKRRERVYFTIDAIREERGRMLQGLIDATSESCGA
jgi:hypothetical protein